MYSSYESDAFDEWTAKVEGVVKINLEKPLLVRNKETMLLTLNFNPEVPMYVYVYTYVRTYGCWERNPESAYVNHMFKHPFPTH